MIDFKIKKERGIRRHKRVRSKISGTKTTPRLYVFCSNQHVYAQLIDDENQKTIVAAKDSDIKEIGKKNKVTSKDKSVLTGKTAISFEVGRLVAQKAIEKKIKKVVFDRGIRLYHGRVKALADGARKEGLEF
ncbi:MAG: 50S ribosomal protein L18 [Patescibacteria group bacterium]|nr:50S ribosomal protein L18 [Patescibacteria group bacterium]MBU1876954.1 50S ribosomal protein L18 [Patescibacteria group bacterium]